MERLLRNLRQRLYVAYQEAKLVLAFALHFLEAQLYRRRSWVVQRWIGNPGLTGARRIAIFVHYDRQGRVADYVLYYLDQLRAAGYTLLFVTNGRRLGEEALAALRSRCGLILRRRNLGYDFGAYRDGLREIPDVATLDSLILANDSVYGPLQSLGDVLQRADPTQADLWGITDSYDRCYHLQTYFLLLYPRALQAPALQRFWERLLYVRSKKFVVRFYEVGFSHAAAKAGLRLQALCPYRALAAQTVTALRRLELATGEDRAKYLHGDYLKWLYDQLELGNPVNPSHYFWDQLLQDGNCPFLKRELLTHNPARVPMIIQWEQVVRQVSDYDTQLIVRHLQQVLRNRSI